MEIISHRGYWKSNEEKNTIKSFENSFLKNFGTETDIRDSQGELVISHDVPITNSVLLSDFFNLYKEINCNKTLALNIKSDGLQDKVLFLIQKYQITNYFIFDASVPDSISYIKKGLNFFTRHSELEKHPVLYNESIGIWLDSFYSNWYDFDVIKTHLQNQKKVAIVSSELHKRNYIELWRMLKENNSINYEDIILCTDLPEDANIFFKS